MSRLRVGFDGRDLLRKRTGVVNYAVHLSRALARAPDADLLLYVDHFRDPDITPPDETPLRQLAGTGPAWKHLALPMALARDGATLFHSPTGTLPLWAPCPRIVTIHDLFASLSPEWFPGLMAPQLARTQRHAARSAARVIAVSQRTGLDIARRYGVPENRIRVIYNGVEYERFNATYSAEELDLAAALQGVRRPFVLCVGSLMPWRNALRLMDAMARVRGERGATHELLFVGRDIWESDVTEACARERGWNWVHFSGYVADDDLPRLYAAASVFACPSLYEGFGIPPVEAMASGIPVVASSGGALPEVLGDAALLPDPHNVGAIADALRMAIEETATRQRLVRMGLQRAALFRWETAAEQTLAVYREIAA